MGKKLSSTNKHFVNTIATSFVFKMWQLFVDFRVQYSSEQSCLHFEIHRSGNTGRARGYVLSKNLKVYNAQNTNTMAVLWCNMSVE